jgi:LPXTG-motif cell wall-anchored protein
MTGDNAACAQYATVECLTPGPEHPLPSTGLDVGWVLAAGVLAVCAGGLIRSLVKRDA